MAALSVFAYVVSAVHSAPKNTLSGDQGLLVYRIQSNQVTLGLVNFVVMVQNVETAEYRKIGNGRRNRLSYEKLPPGKYRLFYLNYAWEMFYPPKDTVFTIRAGDACYIGTLTLSQKVKLGGRFYFSIEDDFVGAQEPIVADWPSLEVSNQCMPIDTIVEGDPGSPAKVNRKSRLDPAENCGYFAVGLRIDTKPTMREIVSFKSGVVVEGVNFDFHRDGGFRSYLSEASEKYYMSEQPTKANPEETEFVVVIKSKPGKHYIDNFTLLFPDDSWRRYAHPLEIEFEVFPNRVTYLGQLHIDIDDDANTRLSDALRFSFIDAWAEDEARYLATHPDLPRTEPFLQIVETPDDLPKLELSSGKFTATQ